MKIEVFPVSNKRELRQFIRFPWQIYQSYLNWVPPLLGEMRKTFDRTRFPFFEHSEAQFYLARRRGELVGRIVAIKNNNHLQVYQDATGFFGFFESIDDQAVADALFKRAEEWLAARELHKIRGPENYSQNEDCGLLVDAFDLPPVIMMPYNPPYYQRLIEKAGFSKAIDLYAYTIEQAESIPAMLTQVAHDIQATADFTIRPVDLKHLEAEIPRLKAVYNAAWSENWGAVPFTDSEINYLKEALKKIALPDMNFIAEMHGVPIGVSVTVPDLNELLIGLNGRLLPFGIFRLLTGMKKIRGVRVLIMGVLKEYRHKGIDLLFYYETFKNGLQHGFTKGEMSWILENNLPMIKTLEKISGVRRYKTYRLYEKTIRC